MNEKGSHPTKKIKKGPFTFARMRKVYERGDISTQTWITTGEKIWYELHWRGGKYGGRGIMFEISRGKIEWDFWAGGF